MTRLGMEWCYHQLLDPELYGLYTYDVLGTGAELSTYAHDIAVYLFINNKNSVPLLGNLTVLAMILRLEARLNGFYTSDDALCPAE